MVLIGPDSGGTLLLMDSLLPKQMFLEVGCVAIDRHLIGDNLIINAVPYGACEANASYCFGRLPGALDEADTELLACDSGGNIYRLV